MKYLYPPPFESLPEKMFFPILYSFTLSNGIDLTYQKKVGPTIGYRKWVYEKHHDTSWADNHSCAEFEGDDGECFVCEIKQKYRIDFVLKLKRISIGIEIDGIAYHRDERFEDERDRYLEGRGYKMMHFTAKDAMYNPYKITSILQSFISAYGYRNFN